MIIKKKVEFGYSICPHCNQRNKTYKFEGWFACRRCGYEYIDTYDTIIDKDYEQTKTKDEQTKQ